MMTSTKVCFVLISIIYLVTSQGAATDVKFLSNTTLNTAGNQPSLCGINNTLVVVYDANQQSDADKMQKDFAKQEKKPGRAQLYEDDLNLRYLVFTMDVSGKISQISGDGYAEGSLPFITAHPSSKMVIAVNGDHSGNSLYYHVGKLTGTTLNWVTPQAGIPYVGEGASSASVSVNNDGMVVATHQTSGKDVRYCVGKFNTSLGKINWYNSTGNSLCNPQSYRSSTNAGLTPSGLVTDDGRVVILHIETSGQFYSVGKLEQMTVGGNQSVKINWVGKELKYMACDTSSCFDSSVMVDPFGTIMEVHYITNNNGQLVYRLGVLHDNYIQWKTQVTYASGSTPAIAFLNSTNYLYGEIHVTPNNNIPQISTIQIFDVELVSITYGPAVPNDKVLFDTKSSEFENNGPATLGESWNIKSEVSCTNTHSWDSSVHAGISVTAKVNFFFESASATAQESVGLTIGESYSSTKTFTWEEDEKIIVPPHVGKVTYSAALYRVEHTVPFVAILKRGPFTWEEKGSVSVTHGAIFTYIYASQQTPFHKL